MADTFTPNFDLVLPEVGGSADTWGTKLNANFSELDSIINTLENRTLTAGDGLTGGGDLSANRTFTLGTPGSITAASTNSVTATSHTHAINLSASDVGAPPTSRSISAGDGLSGGGDLAANRTLSVDSTVVRISRTLTAGDGLSGGGDLSANRTFTLGTPGSITAASTNSVTATSHTHAINLSASDVGAPPTSRTITAGNGLSGGGDLAANLTITLGTPGSITPTSSNSVTATSHTHAISEGTIRVLISQGWAGGVGTYAFMGSPRATRHPGATLAGSSLRFSNAAGATEGTRVKPAGTWRLMGYTLAAGQSYGTANLSLWLRIS